MARHRDIAAAWAGWHTQGRPSTRRVRFLLVGMLIGFLAGYWSK